MSFNETYKYACDNCGAEDISSLPGLPRGWVIVKMETTVGAWTYSKIHLCNRCGFPSEEESLKKTLFNLFCKFKKDKK